MANVFISYRRTDSEHFSARLRDALIAELSADAVFLDVEDIAAGATWRVRLDHELNGALLVIVVIGQQWLAEIQRRQDSNDDPVRWEIATALVAGKKILPITIDGAGMPDPRVLPADIAGLCEFNGPAIKGTRSTDFHALIKTICDTLPRAAFRQKLHSSDLLDAHQDFVTRYANEPGLIKVGSATPYTVPAIALLNAANGADETKLIVEYEDELFESDLKNGEAFTRYMRESTSSGKSFYNTETARLRQCDPAAEGGAVLSFQPTTYFDYVASNMAMDFDYPLDGRLRDEVHAGGRLQPLPTSTLANHTGISGLVFSSDGKMILQKRSAKVFTNPNQLSPGFSGTLTADDIERIISRAQPRGSMADVDVLREMVEEIGLRKRAVRHRHFMGLSRELLRGGLPELFYAVDVEATSTEIMALLPKEKEGSIFAVSMQLGRGSYGRSILTPEEGAKLADSFDKLLAMIEDAGNADASMPLVTNLAFWVNQHQAAIGAAGPAQD